MNRGYNADGNQGESAIDQMDAAKGECRVWGFDPDLAGELLRSPSTAEHGEIDGWAVSCGSKPVIPSRAADADLLSQRQT